MPSLRPTLFTTLALLAASCTAPTPSPSPFLRTVHFLKSDGTSLLLTEKDLSPFQRLIRSRLGDHPSLNNAPLDQLLTLEADVPDGQPDQGAYLALIKSAKGAQLFYIEQANHLPRTDRYYHRPLLPAEWSELATFLKDHPLAQLRSIHPTTQPATQPTTQPASQPAVNPETPTELPINFRLTDAHPKDAQSLLLHSPTADDHPAIDLLKMLAKFRDASTPPLTSLPPSSAPATADATPTPPLSPDWTCTYLQPLPPNATLLYAHPFRPLLRIYADGPDIRALFPSPDATEQWYSLKNNQWLPTSPPPPPAPPAPLVETPAPRPSAPVPPASPTVALTPQDITTLPPEPALPPLEPSRFSNPNILPDTESWTAQPHGSYTAVTHFVPITPTQRQGIEFWVPTFQFDDSQMCVDAPHALLYLIHDGHLFALPIPPSALPDHN